MFGLKNFTDFDGYSSGYYFYISYVNDKTGEKIESKQLLEKFQDLDKNTFVHFCNEANTLLQINHPSIIKYKGYSLFDFINREYPVIITEYAYKKNLYKFLYDKVYEYGKKKHILNDTEKLIIIYGVAAGMSYLHSNNILVRDLKMENICLDEHHYPKIICFYL